MARPVSKAVAKVATIHQCSRRTVSAKRKINFGSEWMGVDESPTRSIFVIPAKVDWAMVNTPMIESLHLQGKSVDGQLDRVQRPNSNV